MIKKRIGIYGGTFSPPHNGHVLAAKEFIKCARLDELLITVTWISPHKEVKGVDPYVRLDMARLAFSGIDKATVSDYEIEKKGVSYTKETLAHFKSEENELFLLVGDDMFLTLDTWKCAEEIFSLTSIVFMRRYLTDAKPLLIKKAEYEEKYAARVFFIDAAAFPVSSTEIREKLMNGESCDGLLDPSLERYIRERGLYCPHKEGTENEN